MQMRNKNTYVLFVVFVLLSMVEFVHLFQIINCGSNKITTVAWNETTKKATIKYDQNSNIPIPFTGPPAVDIWCESDTLFDECVLTRQTKTKSEEKVCEYSPSSECKNDCPCSNEKRINIQNISSHRCTFSFSKIYETGKQSDIYR